MNVVDSVDALIRSSEQTYRTLSLSGHQVTTPDWEWLRGQLRGAEDGTDDPRDAASRAHRTLRILLDWARPYVSLGGSWEVCRASLNLVVSCALQESLLAGDAAESLAWALRSQARPGGHRRDVLNEVRRLRSSHGAVYQAARRLVGFLWNETVPLDDQVAEILGELGLHAYEAVVEDTLYRLAPSAGRIEQAAAHLLSLGDDVREVLAAYSTDDVNWNRARELLLAKIAPAVPAEEVEAEMSDELTGVQPGKPVGVELRAAV